MGRAFLRLKFRLGLESREEELELRCRQGLKKRALVERWHREVAIPWLQQEKLELERGGGQIHQTPSAPLLPSAPPASLEVQEECVVCMDGPAQVVFVPCGHACCCSLCAQRLAAEAGTLVHCPLCRATVCQRRAL